MDEPVPILNSQEESIDQIQQEAALDYVASSEFVLYPSLWDGRLDSLMAYTVRECSLVNLINSDGVSVIRTLRPESQKAYHLEDVTLELVAKLQASLDEGNPTAYCMETVIDPGPLGTPIEYIEKEITPRLSNCRVILRPGRYHEKPQIFRIMVMYAPSKGDSKGAQNLSESALVNPKIYD